MIKSTSALFLLRLQTYLNQYQTALARSKLVFPSQCLHRAARPQDYGASTRRFYAELPSRTIVSHARAVLSWTT